ncbi:hypothetical protein [Streptomyces glomeratus]|uniref:hypothetical protein n=1 Tax=Streptomyces glomeratus TaxID=284452 RepID=UPI001F19BB8D|nr:hypothetical protein [Streptomyces glomeratus]MCF1508040.1 hypothetical protein [Streptomyces glomeratus]
MGSFLLLVLMFAPFVTPFVVMGAAWALAVRVRRRKPGSGWRLPDAGSCALVTVMAGAAGLGAYAYGVMSGFYILDPDQMCAAAGAAGDHVVTRMTLPVSVQCVTEQGEGTELVPSWVNPVVFGGLVVCVLALGAGVSSGMRSARRPVGERSR